MNRQFNQRLIRAALACGACGLISTNLQAKISEPDHILYGNATYFDSVLADGSNISLVVGGQTLPLVEYNMGEDATLGNFYALRIPMDSLEPRAPGTARPGEQVTLFINGEAAAYTQVGERGKAVRLDLDPNNLLGGGPGISISDVQGAEGDAGISTLTFTLSLSTPHLGHDVSVNWVTEDTSATGGTGCTAGVDYVSDSGTATVLSGDTDTTLAVSVCGDEVDELDESFKVTLSHPANGYIAGVSGYGTILDDDTKPTLSVDDIQVVEPSSGTRNAVFTVSLSQVWNATVMVDYTVAAQTATAVADFNSVSGTVTINAGDPTGTISVPVRADALFEPNETFSVTLENAVNADLLDATGIATIVDPAFEPMLAITDEEALPTAVPSAVVVSPGGQHVYVAGYGDDSINLFDREKGTGALTFVTRYDSGISGFESVMLDQATDLAISSDGMYLFAVAYSDQAVNVFARDTATGALILMDSMAGANLAGAISLALSPDDQHVYVAGETANALSVYSWNATLGELSFVESMSDGAASVDGINGATSVAVSVDGRQVYVTGAGNDHAVAVFNRDDVPASVDYGKLSYSGLVRDNLAGVSGIHAASSAAVSPDGVYLYVSGEADNALAQFERDLWTGELTWMDQKVSGDNGVAGMQGPLKVAVSQDGNYVYVLGLLDSSLVVFQRNRDPSAVDYGSLRVVQNMIDGNNGVSGLYSPSDMAVSPDDQHLYITTFDSVLVIQRGEVLIFGDSFD